MQPLMIEVALNESASKAANPNVPYGPEEVARDAVECARAGASIVHFHARDPSTGEQRWLDTQLYLDAFALIRAECDVLLYPTQPGTGIDVIPHVLELAEHPRGRLELATVDILPVRRQLGEPAPELDPIVAQMRELRARGVAFSLGVREIGHVRHLTRYRALGLIDEPQLKLFFSEAELGPPPDARGLLMYLDSVPTRSCRWFVALSGGDPEHRSLRRLQMLAAALGGHIRTGIGAHPRLEGRDSWTNREQVELAVELAHAAGRDVADVAASRALLGIAGRAG